MTHRDSPNFCSVITDGVRCQNKVSSRGWCQSHYGRWQKYGDVRANIPLKKYDGHAKHPLYQTWTSIKSRCSNPNNSSYKYYGGRGIILYDKWSRDPRAFITWIEENLGPRPERMTLDRIDCHGNYEPGNLRWANQTTQVVNSRRGDGGKSGVTGVFQGPPRRDGSPATWRVSIGFNGKQYTAGPCETLDEAVALRDLLERALHPEWR